MILLLNSTLKDVQIENELAILVRKLNRKPPKSSLKLNQFEHTLKSNQQTSI